jgi:hypothetical protein
MKITEPLMRKIEQLRSTLQKELSGLQLIRTFIERRIQPLVARAHCMWDYSDRQDSTRISSDELREAEIDECVRACRHEHKEEVTCAENLWRDGFQQSFSLHRGMPLLLVESYFCSPSALINVERGRNPYTGDRGSPMLSPSARDG